ncbi:WGR domain-containing protein (plasmid) [Pseudonocardia sp. DSM 110487]|uniref:WGR domain-containing protein n=1 Tax=Pseudonocardia sp. DSM 110487 TaxID=2865833 RepID=UPI001C69924C|nr:WGR domain-containing protein [Pseudonocardia sp. DSM 110487]QYN41022.1 WGR domain-containing protein [Pseudonocardia sp. DSM 110487]
MSSVPRAVHGFELRCTTPPHNKFWRAFIAGQYYVVHYGSIGDPGSFRGSKNCQTPLKARLTIEAKIREKINEKGYTTHHGPITFIVPETLIAELDEPGAVRDLARIQLVDCFLRAASAGVTR